MVQMLLVFAAVVFGFQTLLFILAVAIRNNGIVDIGWGIGFILIAATGVYLQPHVFDRQLLMLAVTALWGLRLAVYIFIRSRGKEEDWRYAEWREQWGKNWVIRSFLQVFMLQGAIMLLVASPIIVLMIFPQPPLFWLDFVGAGIFLFGLIVESMGDFQLMAFKSKPENKGKIMTEGIWKYSRHPNYFGETVLWWGIGLIALGGPFGWIGLAGSATITFMLLGVSGVPMLEKGMEKRDGWAEYKAKTSAFFLWPPSE